jgi:pimeloyl-ACP methyl ester carboxylesterase
MQFLKLFLVVAITSFFQTAHADTLDVSIKPGAVYNMAAFRIWLSPDVRTFRGILMLNPGSNSDGREQVDEQYWRDFANKHDFALMGTYLTDHMHPNMMIEDYIQVGKGSGKAILDAIDNFARSSGHEELSYAPFLLWGESAGGQLNHEIASWLPERVIAYVVNKGGYYYSAVPQEATRQTPGLFFIGLDDLPSRNSMIKGMYLTNRRAGALWSLAEEKGVAHEFAGSRDLAVAYYEAVMAMRLPKSAWGYKSLMPVTEALGTTGNIYSHALGRQEGDRLEDTTWLPSEKFAEAWQRLVNKAK